MSAKIKINCRKVFDTGIGYESYAERLAEIKKKLEDLSSSIDSSWQGQDSKTFLSRLNIHIASLDELIDFLSDKGYLLKVKSSRHDTTDKKFADNVKRSGSDGNFNRF